ncbi:TcpQ domain-containing protein [Micavibrio aeruginosavorus]|uniref:TcpQ domain-containing protein n=1 Tax=Micavibrio aeruginosavorus TaxID=349221 RepID=UPI00034B7E4A|nr:TcpQ domain-containing protein [Micavibrio aeruginosavorus]
MNSRALFSSRFLLLGTVCVLTSSFAVPALAGFEFTPPPAASSVSADTDGVMPPVSAVPVSEVEIIDVTMTEVSTDDGATGTVMDDLPPPPRPMPAIDEQPEPKPMMRLSPATEAPHVHADAHPAPRAPQIEKPLHQPTRHKPALIVSKGTGAPAPSAPVQASAPVSAPSHHATAEGFGRDLPLVLAMRQIVPAGYGYVFDPSVDQGQRVDWDGGAAWPTVLENAVAAYGLSVRVMDDVKRVWVGPKEVAAHVAAAPVATPVEAPALPVHAAPVSAPAHEPVREVYLRRGESVAEPVVRDAAPAPMMETPVSDDPVAVEAPTPLMGVEDVGFIDPVATPRAPGDVVMGDDVIQDDMTQDDMMMSDASLTAPAPLAAEEAVQTRFNPDAIQTWKAARGASLRDVLLQWSHDAGVELVWNSARDFKLPAPITMKSNYAEAVLSALSAFNDQDARPLGRLHPNLPQGPSVLVVDVQPMS